MILTVALPEVREPGDHGQSHRYPSRTAKKTGPQTDAHTSNEKEISHGRVSWQADNLSKAGWSWGCVLALVDSNERTIWIADAHRGDGKRFVVRADEKLTAFLELEAAIRRQLLKDSKLRCHCASAPQAAPHWRRRV